MDVFICRALSLTFMPVANAITTILLTVKKKKLLDSLVKEA